MTNNKIMILNDIENDVSMICDSYYIIHQNLRKTFLQYNRNFLYKDIILIFLSLFSKKVLQMLTLG